MDHIVTSGEIAVIDLAQKELPLAAAIWPDSRTAHVDLKQHLDAATPYTLRVGPNAVSESNVPLDGNDDGKPGGADDAFTAAFTGSQTVIVSRLPKE